MYSMAMRRSLTRSLSCGAFLCLAAATPAYGQPVTASGPLLAGNTPAGYVRDVSIVARKWTSAIRFQFELPLGGDDGKAAILRGVIDLKQEDTAVLARTCKDTRLLETEVTSDGFVIEMLPNTEGRVVSRSDRGIVIWVGPPTDRTMGEERLLPSAALVAECPAKPAVKDEDKRETTYLSCEPFIVYARPDNDCSNSFEVTAARSLTAKMGDDGWYRIAYGDFSGYRWLGFARNAPKCTEPPLSEMHGVAGNSVGGPPPCRQARLPGGAVLRAADHKTVLLTVRRDFEAKVCETDHPFESDVEIPSGWGNVNVRGFFDGSPLPPLSPAKPQ